MENRKDIGKAISEKLESLDKMPKDQVWAGIQQEIESKKKKRRAAFFFFWGKALGVLFLIAMIGFYFYSQSSSSKFGLPKNPSGTVLPNNADKNPNTTVSNDGNTNSNASENENRDTDKTNVSNSISVDGKSTASSNNEKSDNDKRNNNSSSKNAANAKSNAKSKNSADKDNANGFSNAGAKSKSGLAHLKAAKGTSKKWAKSKAKKSRKDKEKTKRGKKTNEKEMLQLGKTDNSAEKSGNVDLSALQDKSISELAADIKSKKKDSLQAKKAKDKVINLNMYPKDSTNQDSAKMHYKYYVDAFVSPTLFGYLAKGSTLDRRLDSLSKKSQIKFSFGIGFSYDLSEKLSARIGVRKISISYLTKNVPTDADNYSGIQYNMNISNETIFGASNGAEVMDVTQKISYLEIPIEVKYRFLDKKIGLKSSAGFSFLYLNENSISIKTPNGFSQKIGSTRDLAKTSLSVNLGIEADYPLFKNAKIFVEPMFNYQLKAFSGQNFKPYIFGIHTGIRYSINN